MSRSAILCIASLLAAAACQTTPLPAPLAEPESGAFAAAPRAPAPSELLVCSPAASNVGPVGERGEARLYRPYIFAGPVVLLRNPTEGACLSSGFGARRAADGGGRLHTGLDLANPGGGFVFAAADARVAWAGWRGGFGLTVELDHGRGVRTFYAHLAELHPGLVRGAFVPAGTAIARMGATGNATGVHLHYEVIVRGMRVDPLSYGQAPEGWSAGS